MCYKRAPYQLFCGTPYLLSEICNLFLDLNKAHTLCISHNRGYQTFRSCDRNAKINVVVIDDLVSLSGV